MLVWRLLKAAFDPLSGEGARRAGGRWNSPGIPAVYASEHLSLAVLETLVHVPPVLLPGGLVAHALELPDELLEDLGAATVEGIERAGWSRARTRAAGDAWLRSRRAVALAVPSVIVREERNLVLNPAHPAARRLRRVCSRPFALDPRLAG